MLPAAMKKKKKKKEGEKSNAGKMVGNKLHTSIPVSVTLVESQSHHIGVGKMKLKRAFSCEVLNLFFSFGA